MATEGPPVARRRRSRRRQARLPLGALALAALLAGLAPAASGSVQIRSDEFDGALDTAVWTFVDPLGDSTVDVTGSAVVLSVPAGTAHDLWAGANHAPRLLQDAPDADLEVEVKFDSEVSEAFQIQGVLFVEDDDNWVRFDVHSGGGSTFLFAATLVDDQATPLLHTAIDDGAPVYLRIARAAEDWTLSYSFDGAGWTEAVSFTHSLALAQVGVFAGNAGASPAHSAVVDHFRNRLAPSATTGAATALAFTGATLNATVDPRGGETRAWFEYGAAAPYDSVTPEQTVTGPGPEALAAALAGLAPGTTYHARVVSSNDFGTTAGEYVSFTTPAAPPTVATGTASGVGTTTATLAGTAAANGASTTVWFEYGKTAAYGSSTPAQIVGGLAVEATAAALSGLEAGTTYHFRIVAQNAFGTSHGADATLTTTALPSSTGGSGPAPAPAPPAPPPPPAPAGAPAQPASPAAPYTAIVWGSDGDDFLVGTDFGEAIGARAGNDTIRAGGGADRLYGGEGDDLVFGEDGDDRIWGGPGDDRIAGGSGNDRIGAGPGDDVVYGGPGDDVISGGPGRNRLFGGPGDDLVLAADGERDVIDCGPGHDVVVADFADLVLNCEVVRRVRRSLTSA